MANEKVNEKANEKENEVIKAAVPMIPSLNNEIKEFDVFAKVREREQILDYEKEENIFTFTCPYSVQRNCGGESEDGRKYYNYAIGYMNVVNGREVSNTIRLVPSEKRAEVYDLLDAIFGDEDRCPLRIVRTDRKETENGVTKSTSKYSICVLTEDSDGAEVRCALIPDGSVSRQSFENFRKKLIKNGIIT